MLSKYRLYENKLLCTNAFSKFTGIIDTNYREIWKEKDLNWKLAYASKLNYKKSIKYFISKLYTSNHQVNWNRGMAYAAKGGFENLTYYFVSRLHSDSQGADWNWGLVYAIAGYNTTLIDFFISKLQNNNQSVYWSNASAHAKIYGYKEIVEYLKIMKH